MPNALRQTAHSEAVRPGAAPSGADASLERTLLRHGAGFEFAQVMRLLPRIAGEGMRIRVRPALGVELPRSEVAQVLKDEEGYIVETHFPGLYGAASPLPAFYTEDLIEAEHEERGAAREFLDLIHQRFFALRREAGEKYRPLHATIERGDGRFTQLLATFIGLRDGTLREAFPGSERLLPYLGLLGAGQRSAEGLTTLLEDVLQGTPVEVEEFVPREVRIPARSQLRIGEQGHRLGEAVLGATMADRCGKLRIVIGPLTRERFIDLVAGREEWCFLNRLIAFYLPAPLECEIDLRLAPITGFGACLGGDLALLGRNAWLDCEDQSRPTACLTLGRNDP